MYMLFACHYLYPERRLKLFEPEPFKQTNVVTEDFSVIYSDKLDKLGYIEKQIVCPENYNRPIVIYFIYDINMKRIGFLSEQFELFKYITEEELIRIGSFDLEKGLKELFHYEGDIEIHPMQATSEVN